MILYHGGSEAIEHPDLSHSRAAVDFGRGFYLTPLLNQARAWCVKKQRICATSCVSIYEFDVVAASSLKTLHFSSYSPEWLDFIIQCRREEDSSDWDVISGGIANDRVFDTLEAYFDGFATREQTIAKLAFEEPNLQYCFRTEAALQTLRFLGKEAP